MEKHVSFKFAWDMERLASVSERNGEIVFKYMETDRFLQHLTYFGDYQIGHTITIDRKKVRTVQPYLCGIDMKEEVDYDFYLPLVMGVIITGLSPTQTHNNYLKQVMEEGR
jgi:hypothetical protein